MDQLPPLDEIRALVEPALEQDAAAVEAAEKASAQGVEAEDANPEATEEAVANAEASAADSDEPQALDTDTDTDTDTDKTLAADAQDVSLEQTTDDPADDNAESSQQGQ